MILRSLRSQLTLALLVVILICSALVGIGTLVILRAEQDFQELAEQRIPRVALAGELAEISAELAALSAAIVAWPASSGEEVVGPTDASAGKIASLLADPALRDLAVRRELLHAEQLLRKALLDFRTTRRELEQLDRRLQASDQELRWLHADVQDLVAALLQDLSFEMDARLSLLRQSRGVDQGRLAEGALLRDQQLRDRLQRLASEAATLAALLLQARNASSEAGLDAVERLAMDTLDSIALAQLDLPRRNDLGLLGESVQRLAALALGEDSIISLARDQHALRQESLVHLAQAQAALTSLQSQLASLGQAEREAAQVWADAAAERMVTRSLWLSLLTILGAIATSIVLLLFMRNRILRRIERLSAELIEISREKPGLSAPARGKDEIGDLENAVEVFRSSISNLRQAHERLSLEATERQKAVERLEQMQRELVQAGKMAALGQMSAAISHEINQPLAAIRYRLHSLRARQPATAEAVERIEALLARITGTITHLRRIARRSDFRRQRVHLKEPLQAALDLLDHRLKREKVSLEISPALAGVAVEGDDILLEQVLLNVLGNALDAIRETGRGYGKISIGVVQDRGVTLSIRDDGVGIGEHSPEHLIDPFVTTKEVGEGLGLGLSIAFNVMHDMGGRLELLPRPEGGVEVRLHLKAWKDPVLRQGVEHA